MRRRDKLRLAFRGSKDPATSSVPSTTHVVSPGQTGQRDISASVANDPANSSTTAVDRNSAPRKAIEQHIDTISPAERQSFITTAQAITDTTVLDAIRRHDQGHQSQSSFRSHSVISNQYKSHLNSRTMPSPFRLPSTLCLFFSPLRDLYHSSQPRNPQMPLPT